MAKKRVCVPTQKVAWGDLASGNVHLIPAEPPAGLTANGALAEDTSHEYVIPNRKSDAQDR